ncbi:MAG: M28 family peptidase [Bacteroidia bacterium]
MALPGRSKNKLLSARSFGSRSFAKDAAAGLFVILFVLASCGSEKEQQKKDIPPAPVAEAKNTFVPDFNPDSAYAFVKAQVNFGPRVPGSAAHENCAEWLSKKLKSYGFEVTIPSRQTVQTYDQKQFMLKNIIASYKPELQNRVMICSHWDTRPFCESDVKDKDKPGDGANDGGSGVAVALEIARQVNKAAPAVGVDIIYFDVEDYGDNGSEESWCLGSKYWSSNLHKKDYYASFGILLDMVGGPGATFVKEGYSDRVAPDVVAKVWQAASDNHFGNFFLPQTVNFVGADDHVPVNEQAHIPCIDIIQYDRAKNGFPAYHHTHSDNMDMIDKQTLKAVGQTLLAVIYNEQ